MELRKCRICNTTKSIDTFSKAGVVNGKQYWRHLCISCYSQSKKPRRNKLKEQLKEYKKTCKCERCGFCDYRALQFHHNKGNKEFNIGEVTKRGISWDKALHEIKKCEVLCANCHQIEHSTI